MRFSFLCAFFLAAILVVANAAPSSRKFRKNLKTSKSRFRFIDLKQLPSAEPSRLLKPRGEILQSNSDLEQEPDASHNSLLTSKEVPGSSNPSYVRNNRQRSISFGHNTASIDQVEPSGSSASVELNRSSDPDAESIDNLHKVDSNQTKIALEIYSSISYKANQLADKKTTIPMMESNFDLPRTDTLHDATVSMMRSPSKGFPIAPSNFQIFPYKEHWTHNVVTYKLESYTPDMSPCQVKKAIKRAFRVWEEVTALDFVESDRDDADILIKFVYRNHGDGTSFDEQGDKLAHAFPPGLSPISGDTHFDEAELWTLGKGKVFEAFYGNSDGASCVFPFIFEDEEYDTCITKGRSDGLEWCSTTRNYDADGKFGFCAQETLFTYGGNSEGNPCQFPFIFEGKSYDACTYDGRSDGYKWCATTSNFGSDALWGLCPDRAHSTHSGNSDGAPCVFPFLFQGESYNECTFVKNNDVFNNDNLPWCATTSKYDRDQKFGLCQDDGYSLFLVAAHEFGHAIGLAHSYQMGALMYPNYQKFDNFKLSEDDIRGAQYLYPEPRTTPLRPLVLEKCEEISEQRTLDTTEQTGICDQGPINALFQLGTEIFLFKGRKFWRIQDNPQRQKLGPFTINEQWLGLPDTIDSAYVKPSDHSLVFFKGTRHWIYDGNQIRAGYPKRLPTLDLPKDGSFVVDASLNWLRAKRRQKTYLFVGDKFYRFNENKNKIDVGYPKSMSVWRGVPTDVEAVMENPEKKEESLFVKDNVVHVLNNYRVEVTETIPLDVWLGCREREVASVPVALKKKHRKIP